MLNSQASGGVGGKDSYIMHEQLTNSFQWRFWLAFDFFFLFLIGQWVHANKWRCNGVVFRWLLGYSECSSYILPQVGIPIPRSLQGSTDHLGSYLLVKQMTAWLWCLEFCEPSWMNPLTQWTPFDLGQARMPYAKGDKQEVEMCFYVLRILFQSL